MDPSGIDYREYKRRYGRRVTLSGNIDITWPLVQGTPADVERDVKDHMARSNLTTWLGSCVIYCRSWIKAEGGPPAATLSLDDRPFLRPRGGYWNTIEEDFHWHIEILPQMFRITGFEWASGFFYNPIPSELAARYLSRGLPI